MRTVAFAAVAGLTSCLALSPNQSQEPPRPREQASSAEAAPSCASGLDRLAGASDEFDGPIDGRWRRYDVANGERSAELAYQPNQMKVENGVLRLFVRQRDETLPGYPAGAVESTFTAPGASATRASCVEVRTKGFAVDTVMPDGGKQNVFSAAWLHIRPASEENNPNPELDIQEFFHEEEAHQALHRWLVTDPNEPPEGQHPDHCTTGHDDGPDGPGVDDCHTEPLGMGDLTAGMHTYGLRREVTQLDGEQVGMLTFYVDGRATWRKQLPAKSAFIRAERHVILSTQGNTPGDPRGPFPKVALYGWVHTYN